MNRCSKVLLIAVAFSLGGMSPTPVRANAYDALLKAVPANASMVLGVDHQAMRKHVHYDGLFKFLNSQGFGRQFAVLKQAGIEPGKQVKTTLSFRLGRNAAVSIFNGSVALTAVKKFAKKTLKKAFKSGKHAGRAWFKLSQGLAAAEAGDGLVMVGPLAALKAGLTALDSGKAVTGRPRFSKLRKEASAGDAVVWSISFIPDAVRKKLRDQGAGDMAHIRTSTMRISGSDALSLQMIGHTGDSKGAAEVAGALNGKITRKIFNNRIINALVGHLVRQLSITAKGKTVTGRMKLTSQQVAVVAKYGSRVIKLLR